MDWTTIEAFSDEDEGTEEETTDTNTIDAPHTNADIAFSSPNLQDAPSQEEAFHRKQRETQSVWTTTIEPIEFGTQGVKVSPFMSSPVKAATTLPKNPFSTAIQDGATDSKKKTSLKPEQVLIQEIIGYRVAPQLFFQLEQAYAQFQVPREKPLWVMETGNLLEVLCIPGTRVPVNCPEQCNFRQASNLVLSTILNKLAPVLEHILALKRDTDFLAFPSGHTVSLNPITWLDTNDTPVKLYQVIGLPDGTWLRIHRKANEERIPMLATKRIYQAVETRINRLELGGQTRELSTAAGYLPR